MRTGQVPVVLGHSIGKMCVEPESSDGVCGNVGENRALLMYEALGNRPRYHPRSPE
uniref:Uncharacterized protein n=1 Tax=Anguilla anguilla TaxID=7936 RepID=A0A0E9VQY6_ANGAN